MTFWLCLADSHGADWGEALMQVTGGLLVFIAAGLILVFSPIVGACCGWKLSRWAMPALVYGVILGGGVELCVFISLYSSLETLGPYALTVMIGFLVGLLPGGVIRSRGPG